MTDTKPLNGINLGSWLVAEKWMTPSLFEGTSATTEFQLTQTKQGRERLLRHHQTFISEQDIIQLKEQGIELLRVPIGYWIFGDEVPYVGSIERLDWLLKTSLAHGMKVLLDLHAAQGGQNKAAHSGGESKLHSTKWLNNRLAQDKTIATLVRIAERYKDSPSVWGIQLLNEPTVDMLGTKLARFYRRAYREVIKHARPGTHIVFSDGYAPLKLSNCFWLLRKRDFPVVIDCHIYQVFGQSNKGKTFEQHMAKLKWTDRFLRFLGLMQPVMVGEWSAMLPIKTTDDQTTVYVNKQKKAFESAIAHCYWSYKTEAGGRWNYHDIQAKELIQ